METVPCDFGALKLFDLLTAWEQSSLLEIWKAVLGNERTRTRDNSKRHKSMFSQLCTSREGFVTAHLHKEVDDDDHDGLWSWSTSFISILLTLSWGKSFSLIRFLLPVFSRKVIFCLCNACPDQRREGKVHWLSPLNLVPNWSNSQWYSIGWQNNLLSFPAGMKWKNEEMRAWDEKKKLKNKKKGRVGGVDRESKWPS